MGDSPCQVILLTTANPKPTSAYLINQLVKQELIDAVIVVGNAGLVEKLHRAWRVSRREGAGMLLRRAHAGRLRRRKLGGYRDRYLVRQLFPDGFEPPRFPARVKVLTADRLNSSATAATIASLRPLMAVQAGVGLIRRPLLEIPTIGILSLHHGIMPAIRGMDSILWSFVENRREWAGITVQLIDEGIDTGRIITQASVRSGSRDNPFSVMATATMLGAQLMAQSIRSILASGITNGWPCAETGTYRSSLTPDAIRTLQRICDERP